MIIDIETSEEITEYNKPGELLVQTPSLVLGYVNNEKATAETLIWRKNDRWIKTGDEVLIRLAPSGNEHLVIVDRLKELIKVNVRCFPYQAPRSYAAILAKFTDTGMKIGPPSRANRARSPSSLPRICLRLRCDPGTKRPYWRSTKGVYR
jgi:hypothetical protein